MNDISELAKRLDRLEAIEAIKQLKARYFRFVDEKKLDDLATLFTPAAQILIDGWNPGSPAALAQATTAVGAAPSVHHGHMPEIEITGEDSASGIWAMEDILPFPAAEGAPEGHHGYGQYHETYRRVDRHWLIDTLVLTRFRMEPLENWTEVA